MVERGRRGNRGRDQVQSTNHKQFDNETQLLLRQTICVQERKRERECVCVFIQKEKGETLSTLFTTGNFIINIKSE